MTAVYLAALIVVPLGNLPATVGFALCAGIFNVPILPASYAFATTVTGSMAPAVVTGLMMSFSQMYAFLISLLCTWLLSID